MVFTEKKGDESLHLRIKSIQHNLNGSTNNGRKESEKERNN